MGSTGAVVDAELNTALKKDFRRLVASVRVLPSSFFFTPAVVSGLNVTLCVLLGNHFGLTYFCVH
jgi:hypothetical protein